MIFNVLSILLEHSSSNLEFSDIESSVLIDDDDDDDDGDVVESSSFRACSFI